METIMTQKRRCLMRSGTMAATIAGPDAGDNPRRNRPRPARTGAWRMFCLAAALVMLAPAAAARAASSVEHPGRGHPRGPPVLLNTRVAAGFGGLAENPQVAVRPDGTVDAVWNGVRHGRPLILHAWSTDGGASFSAPETVVRLRPDASLENVITSLAASPRGQLAVCWQQARSADPNDPRVACTVRARHGGWAPEQAILPGNRDRQYLPTAAFQGERLWVAAYVSSATSTRLVAVRGEGRHFGHPLTVNRWPIPSERICVGSGVGNCPEGQTFIGDYIGMVAAGPRVVVAYIQPSASPSKRNRLLVSSFRTK